jgi:hypothetical protein
MHWKRITFILTARNLKTKDFCLVYHKYKTIFYGKPAHYTPKKDTIKNDLLYWPIVIVDFTKNVREILKKHILCLKDILYGYNRVHRFTE